MNKEKLEGIILYQLGQHNIDITWEPIPRRILEEGGQLNKLTVADDSILSKAHIIEDISGRYKDIKTITMNEMLLAQQAFTKLIRGFVITISEMKTIYAMVDILDNIRKKIDEKIKELSNEFNDVSDTSYLSLNYDINYDSALKLDEIYNKLNDVTKSILNIDIGANNNESELTCVIKNDIIGNGTFSVYIDEKKKKMCLSIWITKYDYSFKDFVTKIDEVFKTKQILYLDTRLH